MEWVVNETECFVGGLMWPVESPLRKYSQTTNYNSDTIVSRALSVTLIAGFSALIGMTLVAHTSPATGYELSIYRSTPVSFWILWVISIVAALIVCVYAPRTRLVRYGLLLGGLGAFAIPALPLLRGYYFLGVHDALTHLGYARAVSAGARSPLSLVYPTGHTTAVVLSRLGATGLPHAMMRTTLAFIGIFFITVPLTVRTLIGDQRAIIIAAFSAFLLLPVNTISTYAIFHPFSIAVFYFPVLLYLVVSYIAGENDGNRIGPLSVTGAVLLLAGAAYLFLHPQASLNFIILLCAIAGLQSFQRLKGHDGIIANSPRVHGYALVLIAVFLIWNSQHWQFFVSAQNTFDAVINTMYGQSQAGEVVTRQSSTAKRIGLSPLEIFSKLFLVEALYCMLAAGVFIRYVVQRRNGTGSLPNCEAAIIYLTVAGLALLPFFVLQFLGAVSSYFFRHIGFGLVLVTVLGAIGLYSFLSAPPKVNLLPALGKLRSAKFWRPALVVAGVLLLALSAVALFGSPFMHKYTKHADEQQMMGWETSFEEQPLSVSSGESGRVWYGTTRTPLIRYKQALAYTPGTSWYPGVVEPFPIPTGTVNESSIQNGLVNHYQTHPEEVARRDHYFAVSTMTRERAIYSFKELRYSEESFNSIENQRGVHRIQSNGGFVVYYVDLPDSEPMDDY